MRYRLISYTHTRNPLDENTTALILRETAINKILKCYLQEPVNNFLIEELKIFVIQVQGIVAFNIEATL